MKNQLKKLVLTDEETLNEVVNCLAQHIPINSTGAGEPQNLFMVLAHSILTLLYYIPLKKETELL